jgi:hypothetical protein
MMTSAPTHDPDQFTVYRRSDLMFLLVGTITLTSVNLGFWTFFIAVTRYFGWLGGSEGVYIVGIGIMGFAATQLIVCILGIVLLLRGKVNGRNLRT